MQKTSWHWRLSITFEGITKRQLRFTKRCCWKVGNIRLSTCILHCVTIRCNTMTSACKFCRVMRLSNPKVSLLPTWRLATTTKFIRERTRNKSWGLSSRSLKGGISSSRATFSGTIWSSLGAGRTPCRYCRLWFNCSRKPGWTWSFIAWRTTALSKPSIW